jgi:hypothetical protein
MLAQCFYGCVVAGDLGFCQGSVNLAVADRVQKDGWPALSALEARNKMMPALRNSRRNRSAAERADRTGSVVWRHSLVSGLRL